MKNPIASLIVIVLTAFACMEGVIVWHFVNQTDYADQAVQMERKFARRTSDHNRYFLFRNQNTPKKLSIHSSY